MSARRFFRRAAIPLLAPLVALATMTFAPLPASAADNYPSPDRNAVNCSATLGASSWCIDRNGNGIYEKGEDLSSRRFGYRNCTDFVAFRLGLSWSAFGFPVGSGNAKDWKQYAGNVGYSVTTNPSVGDIAGWSTTSTFGHVALVSGVNADGSVSVEEYNQALNGLYGTRGAVRAEWYLHKGSASSNVAQYANTIVKWDGDPVTSWFVTPDLRRLWIPDGGTYNELRSRGFAGPFVLPSASLNQLPDQSGFWVASGAVWGANRTLRRGMSVRSTDGRYVFAMQTDGNLVLYGPSGRALWATSWLRSGWSSQQYVVFQGDGNLVTYSNNGPIWWTGTSGRGANQFIVQGDGNLVVYSPSGPLWASNTAGQV